MECALLLGLRREKQTPHSYSIQGRVIWLILAENSLLPSSAQELPRLQTAPTPTPSPGQADNGPEIQVGPRPLPAAPRGHRIEKHKAIFKVLFVYPLGLCKPEKWYHLWEVALISFLTCSKPHFCKFEKSQKGDSFQG